MIRREFLKLLALAVIGGANSVCMGSGENLLNRRSVLVIGSGLSGLAAARELHRNGADVIVLEARNRIGGRIWTSSKWQEMPLDMGATWIHGVQENPISQLADEIKSPRAATWYDRAITYSTGGKPLSGANEKEMERLSQRIFSVLRKAQSRDPDRSILQTVQPLMWEYRESPEILGLIQYILNSELEQEYSGRVATLSTHWYDDDKEFDGGDALFLRGFGVITDYLADGLQVELSQEVKAINWDGAEAHVRTAKAEFRADHVIVTLPLGVLKSGSVSFEPELPPEKQNAISKIGMGVLNKCYLRFDKAFWPEDVDWLGYVSAQRGEWTTWLSLQRAAKMPVLLGFNAADRGREIESWSDQRIVASAMQTLKFIFGDSIPDPVDYQISRWASDPFAKGSYSYNALGSKPEMRDNLMKPLANRLFFAGEAVSRHYFGTAHGAYLSGLRAAKNVLSA